MARPPSPPPSPPCAICGDPAAPFGLGWPGLRRDVPPGRGGYRWHCGAAPCAAEAERRRAEAIGLSPAPAAGPSPSPKLLQGSLL